LSATLARAGYLKGDIMKESMAGEELTVSGERTASDDRYAIHAAKTRLREGYKRSDVERILSVFADSLTDLSEGYPSYFAPDGKEVLRAKLQKLFQEYEVELTPIVIDIVLAGNVAVEYGWHVMTLRPKAGGLAETRRTRYMETWVHQPDLGWRIVVFIDNMDQEPKLADAVIGGLID
jgi:ketosteroid isomerase-like protein